MTNLEKDLIAKLTLVLEHYVESDDGIFMFPDGEAWPCKKRSKFVERGQSSAFCHQCARLVTTTFERRDVPLSDNSDTVKGVLAGICASCGEIISIPNQQVLKKRIVGDNK